VVGQDPLLEEDGHRAHDRQYGADDECQLPIADEHTRQARHHVEGAPSHVHQGPGDGIGQALGVGGHAGQDIAHGGFVIVVKRKFLEPGKPGFSYIVANMGLYLAGLYNEQENRQGGDHDRQEIEDSIREKPLDRAFANEGVNGIGIQIRHCHIHDSGDHHAHADEHHVLAVGFGKAQELFPSTQVYLFILIFFFLVIHAVTSSSSSIRAFWMFQTRLYRPSWRINCSWVPTWAARPSSRTRMMSASMSVEIRWDMMSVVVP